LIDSHCHYSDERVFVDADRLIGEAQARGVRKFYLAGTHSQEWARQLELKRRFPGLIKTAFGVHPWWAEKFSETELLQELEQLKNKIHAADGLGETGLDFSKKRDPAGFERQQLAFESQINLALSLAGEGTPKPLVLHVVAAWNEVWTGVQKIIGPNGRFLVPVVLHRYSGSVEESARWVRAGALISISVDVIHPARGPRLQNVVHAVPVEQLLIETDAPDLPDQDLAAAYQWVAQAKGVAVDTLAVERF
jgi:TatD DNase family protein